MAFGLDSLFGKGSFLERLGFNNASMPVMFQSANGIQTLKPDATPEERKKAEAEAEEQEETSVAGANQNWQRYFEQHPETEVADPASAAAKPEAPKESAPSTRWTYRTQVSPDPKVVTDLPAPSVSAKSATPELLKPEVHQSETSASNPQKTAEVAHQVRHKIDLSKLPFGQAVSEEVLNQFVGNDPLAKKNVRAFLDTLAYSEGTIGLGNKGYNVKVGGALFDDSTNQFPTGVVDLGHGLRSSASGRYQIMQKTWTAYQNRLGLKDFSPASQDAVALQLIKERGALEDIKAGRFDVGATKVRSIWASLPGAGYGQHENEMGSLRNVYALAGGQVEGDQINVASNAPTPNRKRNALKEEQASQTVASNNDLNPKNSGRPPRGSLGVHNTVAVADTKGPKVALATPTIGLTS